MHYRVLKMIYLTNITIPIQSITPNGLITLKFITHPYTLGIGFLMPILMPKYSKVVQVRAHEAVEAHFDLQVEEEK